MQQLLASLSQVKKVYPSDANFLLIEFSDSEYVYSELIKKKIIVRNRTKDVKNCLRITVGKAEENNILIKTLKAIENEKSTFS